MATEPRAVSRVKGEGPTEAEAREREAIEAEFPPSRPGPEWSEAIATLRLARARRGMSLERMAEISQVDRMAISRIERGLGNPTVGTLGRMSAALGLRPVLTFESTKE